MTQAQTTEAPQAQPTRMEAKLDTALSDITRFDAIATCLTQEQLHRRLTAALTVLDMYHALRQEQGIGLSPSIKKEAAAAEEANAGPAADDDEFIPEAKQEVTESAPGTWLSWVCSIPD